MSIAHEASRLVSAANRHGVLVLSPTGSVLKISETTRKTLREIVGDDSALPREEVTAVEAGMIAARLNRIADERRARDPDLASSAGRR